MDIDLRDANDLLPPLAAILAVSGGGRLRGAAHAKHGKQSNTFDQETTGSIWIDSEHRDDGLSIEGGQALTMPDSLVDTYGDHRIQMTAVLLATQTGAMVEGPRLHRIADPEFLNRLSAMPTEVLVKESNDSRKAVGRPHACPRIWDVSHIFKQSSHLSDGECIVCLDSPSTCVQECQVILASLDGFQWCAILWDVL